MLDRLRDACSSVTLDAAEVAEASRDWWPLGMVWALDGGWWTPRPSSDPAPSRKCLAAICNDARVPLTVAAAQRRAVSVPVHGGVVLDLTGLAGSSMSTIARARRPAGDLRRRSEDELRTELPTLGHWPQSVGLSTVGGWLACRSAGQMSNKYGKIEDLVLGLDVVLADGSLIHTGGAPRSGPISTRCSSARRARWVSSSAPAFASTPLPPPRPGGLRFGSFADGLDACRRIIQRAGARR